MLLIESEKLDFQHVIHAGLWIKPIKDDLNLSAVNSNLYLVGATHTWEEFSSKITQYAREELTNRTKKYIISSV